MTRKIHVGNVPMGGGAPIVIQSMCNTCTGEAEATLAQIHRLRELGCQVVRVALPSLEQLPGFRAICQAAPIPVIADIHLDHRLALAALEAGADGIRINPGNLRDKTQIREIAKEAAATKRCVRIGVNMGSLSPTAQEKYGRSAKAMVESALEYLGIFEEAGCESLKVSLKSSDLRQMVAACREFASRSDWPQHLGVTEAGTPATGSLKSAIGIGVLLLDGIGDTIRVSLTAPPEVEIPVALRILAALGLRPGRPEIISCPTCGRTRIDLIPLAEKVEEAIDALLAKGIPIPFRKIAIMGCEINGPGEAREADIGIAGGNGQGLLFKRGTPVKTFPEKDLFQTLMDEIRREIPSSLP